MTNVNHDRDKLLAKLYLSGLNTYQVAAAAQVTQGMVARALRRTKTPRRSHAEAQRLARKKRGRV